MWCEKYIEENTALTLSLKSVSGTQGGDKQARRPAAAAYHRTERVEGGLI